VCDALKRRNGVEGFTNPTAARRRHRHSQKHSEKHTPYSPAKPLSHWRLVGSQITFLSSRVRLSPFVFALLPYCLLACSAGFILVYYVVQPSLEFWTFHVRYCLLWISILEYISRSIIHSLYIIPVSVVHRYVLSISIHLYIQML
jgi:hypothetical protein